MKLIIVRHGETVWNAEGREMGQLDAPLTERGLDQIRRLADQIGKEPVAAIYSSDLGRALRTAEAIAGTCHVAVQPEPGLRERNMGIFQGLTADEIRQRFPVDRERFEEDADYAIPGGESGPQRSERTTRAFTQIAERHSAQTVVAVTHSGVLRGFFELVLAMPPGQGWRFRRDNAAYNAFEYQPSKWTLATWNDVSHLA